MEHTPDVGNNSPTNELIELESSTHIGDNLTPLSKAYPIVR